jgi:hypothetical protein
MAVAMDGLKAKLAGWNAREHEPAFLESLAKARQQVEQGKTVSHANLKTDTDFEKRQTQIDGG